MKKKPQYYTTVSMYNAQSGFVAEVPVVKKGDKWVLKQTPEEKAKMLVAMAKICQKGEPISGQWQHISFSFHLR